MCGITGFWHRVPQGGLTDPKSILRAMTDTLYNRGPDEEGLFLDERSGIALGHRRLSILELSPLGAQPMTSMSGRYTIVYNGEVYNSPELSNQLLEKGIHCAGHSDTRVILEMIDSVGIEKTLPHLIGMFAFALWDHKEQELYLARDRIGVKPLYFGIQNNTVVFGSTLHPIRACPFFHSEINYSILPTFLKYNCVPETECAIKEMEKVQPGEWVRITKTDVYKTKYWSLSDVAEAAVQNQIQDPVIIEEQLHTLLKDCIKKRMMADVPLGAFLSGGIDSSLVVAIMQSISREPIRTFAIGFEDQAYNEAPFAKKIAHHLGTNHIEQYCNTSHVLDIVPKISSFYDEPFSDSSQIPTYLVSQIAKKHVTVSLSGDGGDELFGGYNRHIFVNSVFNKLDKIPAFLKTAAKHCIHMQKPKTWNTLLGWIPGCPRLIGDKLYKMADILGMDSIVPFYTILGGPSPAPYTSVVSRYELPSYPSNLSNLESVQFLDLMTYLPSDIMTKVDRASMGVSLEAREPLLDHRLIEFSFKIPGAYKIKGKKGKIMLRRILQKYIPNDLFDRPKMGFGLPIGQFLKENLRDWAEDLLDPKMLEQSGFNTEVVQRVWSNHLNGGENNQYLLWSILMWQSWTKDIRNSK